MDFSHIFETYGGQVEKLIVRPLFCRVCPVKAMGGIFFFEKPCFGEPIYGLFKK